MFSFEVPFTDGDDAAAVPGAFVGGAEMTAGVGMVVPTKKNKTTISKNIKNKCSTKEFLHKNP